MQLKLKDLFLFPIAKYIAKDKPILCQAALRNEFPVN